MSYSSEVLADSPLFWLRNNEASGTTCTDSSGNSRTFTYSATGITYSVAGAVTGDTAITTNGTAGRIKSNATLDLSAFSSITVEMWASVSSFPGGDKLMMETSANAGSNNGAFYLDPNSGGGHFDMLFHGAGGNNVTNFPLPTTGVFHHYVFILRTNTGAGAQTCRVDKVAKTMTDSVTNQVTAFGNYTVNIASRDAASLFWAATIDEVAIYGSALSTARSDAHFDAATGSSSGSPLNPRRTPRKRTLQRM